ncbi:ureidoglycolate hydrolase-domain-containing protein [Cladochytrium replicatum]|nr:ureidoglycolate hydrolase-domain-containing protein [Cladochytrium replicatum]
MPTYNNNQMTRSIVIRTEPLTREAFAEFGHVIEAGGAGGASANQGTATRFNFLAPLVNLRARRDTSNSFNEFPPDRLRDPPARENVCVFKVRPRSMPFQVKLLERHKYSTQLFCPMGADPTFRYLVIVSKAIPYSPQHTTTFYPPDPHSIRAFIATANQAISYHPGTWHHPLISLGSANSSASATEVMQDFLCVVFERRVNQALDDEDTEEIFFVQPGMEDDDGILVYYDEREGKGVSLFELAKL